MVGGRRERRGNIKIGDRGNPVKRKAVGGEGRRLERQEEKTGDVPYVGHGMNRR